MIKALAVCLTFFAIYSFSMITTHSEKPQYFAYDTNWESVQSYKVPQWFKDAKLGIFVDWGIYNVPKIKTPYYARLMDFDSVQYNANGKVINNAPHPLHNFHVQTYGPTAKYEDFIPLYTAQYFNADDWARAFKASGAKYVISVAEHHDGFAMYNSQHTDFNSLNMGPKRDLTQELIQATKKQNLKVGLSSHFAFNWNFHTSNSDQQKANQKLDLASQYPSQAVSQTFIDHWWGRTKDIIDQYEPDVMWFDFYMNKNEFKPYHEKLALYYYNKGIDWNREVVLQSQDKYSNALPKGTNVMNFNYSKVKEIKEEKWQANIPLVKYMDYETGEGKHKKTRRVIEDFVDIISKNGNALLHIFPNADGTIPDQQIQVLEEVGVWMNINQKAIYGATTWVTYGKGTMTTYKGAFSKQFNLNYSTQDSYRFTKNNNKLYVFLMNNSEDGVLEVTDLGNEDNELNIRHINLLGTEEEVEWKQTEKGLSIFISKNRPSKYARVYEIEFENQIVLK
ncbi:alpha-L-fucosidase [Flammeovirga aprica]|uniref:alpha-L-fucosidase n=1 Tax=Flammeovirga aprica JL-4 TaxID=694437 RepID=A0A7X9XAR0_9BACT|nr:alpha-L-fucosidase [Flammeovirga aprica]NME69868.1 alpha-L-fucosidase [Flammeovirga aprica JL-4]